MTFKKCIYHIFIAKNSKRLGDAVPPPQKK